MTSPTSLPRLRLKDALTGTGAPWRIAGAALLLLTVAGQHPHHDFGRVRARDHFSLLPNWRFFAPHPAMFDYHFLYRTVGADGTSSAWRDASGIVDRKPLHLVWFPTRRADKSVFDACQEILPRLEQGFAAASHTPGYRLITEHVRTRIAAEDTPEQDVRGFQFALASGTGYDLRQGPQLMFVSPFVPLDPHAPSTPLTPITPITLAKTDPTPVPGKTEAKA